MMHATVNDCSDKNHGTFCFQQEDIGSVIKLYNFPDVKDKVPVRRFCKRRFFYYTFF